MPIIEGDEISSILADMNQRMEASLSHLNKRLGTLRVGTASSSIFEGIAVDVYGTSMPLNQIANIMTSDSRNVIIQAWDSQTVDNIINSIISSDLGFNPIKEAGQIRVPIPPLSEERRVELSKAAMNYGEDCKIAIRDIRRDGIAKAKALDISKDDKKNAEKKVQKITDDSVANATDLVNNKKKSIMSI